MPPKIGSDKSPTPPAAIDNTEHNNNPEQEQSTLFRAASVSTGASATRTYKQRNPRQSQVVDTSFEGYPNQPINPESSNSTQYFQDQSPYPEHHRQYPQDGGQEFYPEHYYEGHHQGNHPLPACSRPYYQYDAQGNSYPVHHGQYVQYQYDAQGNPYQTAHLGAHHQGGTQEPYPEDYEEFYRGNYPLPAQHGQYVQYQYDAQGNPYQAQHGQHPQGSTQPHPAVVATNLGISNRPDLSNHPISREQPRHNREQFHRDYLQSSRHNPRPEHHPTPQAASAQYRQDRYALPAQHGQSNQYNNQGNPVPDRSAPWFTSRHHYDASVMETFEEASNRFNAILTNWDKSNKDIRALAIHVMLYARVDGNIAVSMLQQIVDIKVRLDCGIITSAIESCLRTRQYQHVATINTFITNARIWRDQKFNSVWNRYVRFARENGFNI